jgi:hypothetical protein
VSSFMETPIYGQHPFQLWDPTLAMRPPRWVDKSSSTRIASDVAWRGNWAQWGGRPRMSEQICGFTLNRLNNMILIDLKFSRWTPKSWIRVLNDFNPDFQFLQGRNLNSWPFVFWDRKTLAFGSQRNGCPVAPCFKSMVILAILVVEIVWFGHGWP